MLKTLATLVLFSQLQTTAPVYTKSVDLPSGIVQMQTAAQQLTKPGKPDIWLVGAVHIGSKPYYASLQKLLDQQELVLFEGVKPSAKQLKEAEEAKAAAAKDPQAKEAAKPKGLYTALSDALGLEFQLSAVNYKHANWKNSDLSWDDMERISKENADAKAGGDPAKAGNAGGGLGMIKNLFDPNSPNAKMLTSFLEMASPGTKEALKLIIVKNVASGTAGGFDEATSEVVLTARNKAVLKDLEAAMNPTSGKAPKSIAIFYGANHLAEMEKEILAKYGYSLGKKEWFTSAEADPSKVDATGQMLLDSMAKRPKTGGGTKR